jgi:hypothetical protein
MNASMTATAKMTDESLTAAVIAARISSFHV